MNKLWIILILSSLVALSISNPMGVLLGLSSAGHKAVKLCFELMAIYAIWTGIFNILHQTKLSKWIEKVLSPIITLIFGKNTLSDESRNYVSMNMSANILGMNGAATPLGIKAIEAMNKDNKTGKATYPMIMLIVLCCTSLQLFPGTIVGMLSSAGSTNPSAIIIPSIVAGLISTVVGVLFVKLFNFFDKKIKFRKKKNG
ncbi:MAG: hypothetical protein IJ542_01045 [Clostridia bacterium]|nr:hypothetical protein [Clostridia bacterium]